MLITILGSRSRRGGSLPGGGGGGGGDFPYGAAALPTGMSWNYTEGGTRIVTGSPLSFSYSSVPSVTGTERDAGTEAAFSSALAASADGDGIRITADFSVSSGFQLPDRSSAGGWVLIYTDRKASFDTSVPYSNDYLAATTTNRAEAGDVASLMRTITRTGTGSVFTVAQGAEGYWFCGVKLTRSGSAVSNAIVDLGASGVSAEAQLANRIVFDRCIVDAAELSRRCISANCKDLLISGSTIINAVSTPISQGDSQAIAAWGAGKGMLFYNNAESAESEVVASGGDSPWITNLQPFTDVASIRNHFFKPSGWDSDVTYALKKNMYEMKTGQRVLFFGNVLDRFRSSPGGQFHQLNFVPTNQNNDASWQGVFDLTVVGNLMINGTEGGPLSMSAQGSSSNLNAGGARWTFVHNYQRDGSADSQSKIQVLGDAARQHSVVDTHLEHNTFHCDETWFTIENGLSGVGDWERFVCRNNANARAATYGPVFTSTTTNAAALDDHLGAGNWTFANNGQVSGGASWGATLLGAPHNNVQDSAANLFTDPGSADYSAKAAGPLDGTGTDGFDIGADVAWVLSLTTGVT